MANIDLTKYGITGTTEIVYNPIESEPVIVSALHKVAKVLRGSA